RGVRLDIDAVVAHIGELFPSDRLSTPQTTTGDPFRVDEHGKGVTEFLHDRPRDFVLRFPAVIEANDRAAWRYVLLAAFPGLQILHGDDCDPAVLQFFHLRFERRWRDLSSRIPDLIDQTMITENNRLSRLIDDRLRNLG